MGWHIRLGLLILSTVLLSLAFAPFNQFYLAWFGLAPFLVAAGTARTRRRAFLWGWLGATIFFLPNFAYLFYITVSGTIGLSLYMALFWALAAVVIRHARLMGDPSTPGGLGLAIAAVVVIGVIFGIWTAEFCAGIAEVFRDPHAKFVIGITSGFLAGAVCAGAAALLRYGPLKVRIERPGGTAFDVIFVAVVWVACEWLRGTLLTGLPWLYIGHTQSQILAMCQIADVTGVYGVSFWVAIVNGLVALVVVKYLGGRGSGRAENHPHPNPLPEYREREQSAARQEPRPPGRSLVPAAVVVFSVTVILVAYGFWRLMQRTTVAGPVVMVVQPNNRHVRGKELPHEQEKSVQWHMAMTLEAMKHETPPDLIVWSETTMPPLNQEARTNLLASGQKEQGEFLTKVNQALIGLSSANRAGLLAGGYYVSGWKVVEGKNRATDIRNAAFFYNPQRKQVTRYDKVHLVPFGEFIPFSVSLPWLFQAFMMLSPYQSEKDTYTINWGDEQKLTAFELDARVGEKPSSNPWKFVTPICFEDLDAPLVRRMIKDESTGGKRADFIINITNDGWFRYNAMAHHFQASLFRCIENRVPMARSVNTGVSGFVDSNGRIGNIIWTNRTGTATQQLMIDSRVPVYMRVGDVFAITCVVLSALLTLFAWALAH